MGHSILPSMVSCPTIGRDKRHPTPQSKHQTSNIDLFYLGIDAVYVSGHKTSSKSTINCLIDFIELNDNLLKPNYFVLSVCASD